MDFDSLEAKYGIGQTHVVQNNDLHTRNTPAPKTASSGFSAGNLVKQVGQAAGAVGGFIGHQLIDPIYTAGKAVVQGAPIVGTIDQHYRNIQTQQKALDAASNDAIKRYRSKDPNVKISKDEYNRRMADIAKQSGDMLQHNQQFTNNIVKPGDAVKALAETGLMATGLGELKAGAVGIKALTKLSPEYRALQANRVIQAVKNPDAYVSAAAKTAANAPKTSKIVDLAKGGLKYSLGTRPALDAALATPGDIKNKDWTGVAENAAAFVGAPLAVKGVEKAAPTLKRLASDLLFNKPGSEINKLQFKNGETVATFLNGLAQRAEAGDKQAAKDYAKYHDTAKVLEDHYQSEHLSKGGTKAFDIAAYHQIQGKPIGKLTAREYLDIGATHAKADTTAAGLVQKGRLWLNPNEGRAQRAAAQEAAQGAHVLAEPTTPSTGPNPLDSIPASPTAVANTKQAISNAKKFGTEETPITTVPTKASTGPGELTDIPEALHGRVGAGKFDVSDQKNLLNRLLSAGSAEERNAIIEADKAAGATYTQNPLTLAKVQLAAAKDDPAAIKAEFNDLKNTPRLGVVGRGRTGLEGTGYIPIIKNAESAGFKAPHEVADLVRPTVAPLGKIGAFLEKSGISPKGSNARETYANLTANMNDALQGTRFQGQGQTTYNRLIDALGEHHHIYDPRMLSLQNIEDALRVSHDDAKVLRSALDTAYNKTPLGARSLGEKVTDWSLSHIPGQRQYLKAQGILRFSANPIFWLKRDIKTEAIAQAEVGGKAINLNRTLNNLLGTAPSSDTMKALTDAGYFSKGRTAGDMSDFMGDYANMVHSNVKKAAISPYLRQSMGQTAEQFARQHGMTVQQLLADNTNLGKEFDNILRLTVGYGKADGSGYLTSNLAKTLNVFVFPSRFDTKVGMAAAKWFSQQPPVIQGAVTKGLLNLNDFFHSPEGQKWSHDNSELLGMINYFTPTETFANVMASLQNPGQTNLTDFGSIGGLPFGVITTILQNQGIIPKQPFNDPKTGLVHTESIPTTDKARLQVAITDLLNSMYSFPGATLGFESKNKFTQGLTPGLLTPDSGSMKTVNPSQSAPPKGAISSFGPNSVRPGEPASFLKSLDNAPRVNLSVPMPAPITPVYPKNKKTKKAPAYLNGFKTRTARPIQ